jgi:hypothetical protein
MYFIGSQESYVTNIADTVADARNKGVRKEEKINLKQLYE